MKRTLSLAIAVAFTLLLASPAWAPFHLIVIDRVFFGTPNAPHAQYVDLRTLAASQVLVASKQFNLENPDGSDAGLFGAFSSTYFPHHSATGAAMLVGTQEAQDLLCLPMDQIVTGSLLFPDGRVCFAIFDYLDGLGPRPVDCVAYGNFTAPTAPYLPPAMTPQLGLELARVAMTDNNQNDFTLEPPMPHNNPGQAGAIDGIAGDADGSGTVDAQDVDALVSLLFSVSKRCDIGQASQRGADANVDTRVGAADLVATADAVAMQS